MARERRVTKLICLLMSVLFFLSNCSGVKVKMKDAPEAVVSKSQEKCGTIAVMGSMKDKRLTAYADVGDPVFKLVESLKGSQLFEWVDYVLEPGGEYDLVLNSQYVAKVKQYPTRKIFKVVGMSLTVLLSTLVTWFHGDCILSADVDVYRGSEKVWSISTSEETRVSWKLLSWDKALAENEGNAFDHNSKVVNSHIIAELSKFCRQ